MISAAIMATGPRVLRHPTAVRATAAMVAAEYPLVVTGGAEGADTQVAWAAVDATVPFEVWLPNRVYRQAYPKSIPAVLLDRAVRVRHIVDREVPAGMDPMVAWRAARWFADNFARNTAMAREVPAAMVVSPEHPIERAQMKGGTAHCIRALVKAGHDRCLWVRDAPGGGVEEVVLVGPPQPTLFDPHPPSALG